MDVTIDNDGDHFPCETFRFQLRIRTLTVLPPYKGAVFRGAFGNALRRLVCAVPGRDCNQCELQTNCVYITVFKPKPFDNFTDAGKYANAPPPYILIPPATNRQAFYPHDKLEFTLTLIGRALDTLPYCIFAFDKLGRRGLGKERGRYQLRQVKLQRNGQTSVVYDCCDQIIRALPPVEPDRALKPSPARFLTLELQTPLRIKRKGKLVTRLNFFTLFNNLAQRLTLLNALYGQANLLDLPELKDQASQIKTVQDQTFWYDWSRYSTSQKKRMKLGGLRGKITFEGDLAPFIPWLQQGTRVHMGQGTTFGLGGYSLIFS